MANDVHSLNSCLFSRRFPETWDAVSVLLKQKGGGRFLKMVVKREREQEMFIFIAGSEGADHESNLLVLLGGITEES
jgi:hypothetical protein